MIIGKIHPSYFPLFALFGKKKHSLKSNDVWRTSSSLHILYCRKYKLDLNTLDMRCLHCRLEADRKKILEISTQFKPVNVI